MFKTVALTYKNAFSNLSRENWLLSLVMLINRSGTMVVPFMSIYVTQVLGRSIADAGLIITFFGVGAVLGSLAGGYLTDKIGFRPVQIIASLLTGIMFLLFGRVNDFTLVCIISVIIGCVSEAFRPANFTAIASYSNKHNIAQSYSLNRLAVNIGFGLGSTVGGILASINFHLLFWVEGIVYMIVSLLIVLLLPKQKIKKIKLKNKSPEHRLRSPYKDKLFLKFIFFITIYVTCFYLVFRLVPIYWKEYKGIPENHIGFILGLNGIIIAIFEMILIKHLEKKKKDIFFIAAGIVFAAFSFLFLIVPFSSVWAAVLMIIFFTLGEMLSLPFINTFVVGRANEENRGRYASAFSLSWATAQIIGPAGGAFIAQKINYHFLWTLLIILCLISSLGIQFIFKKEKVILKYELEV